MATAVQGKHRTPLNGCYPTDRIRFDQGSDFGDPTPFVPKRVGLFLTPLGAYVLPEWGKIYVNSQNIKSARDGAQQ